MEKRIFDFLDHKLTPEEREHFLLDVGRNEELARLYAEILSLRGFDSLKSRSGDVREANEQYVKFVGRTKSRNRRKTIFVITRYAAAVLLAAAVSWLSVTNYRLNNPTSGISFNTVSIPAGQRVSVTLNDGTLVWLNSMSTLIYPVSFASDQRTVRLKGEAYFEVAHDPDRPFVVEGPKIDVRVLGTKFNMRDYADSQAATVSLVEGSVEVADSGHSFARTLSPNQILKYADDRVDVSEMQNYDNLLWKDGIYAFEGATLAHIAEMLEVWYDVTIVIESPALLQHQYSGKFRQQDGVYEILRILQQFYRFSVERRDATRTIVIK